MPPTPLIRTRQAAELLGRHPSTITRWAANGRLTPELRAGEGAGPMLFRQDHVEALAVEYGIGTYAPRQPKPLPPGVAELLDAYGYERPQPRRSRPRNASRIADDEDVAS